MRRGGLFGVAFLLSFLSLGSDREKHPATAVPVRYREGLTHGFLVLRGEDGKVIAEGDLLQTVQGERVTSHLLFHFKDGSVHDETVTFSQNHVFRILRYHLVEKGRSFPHPIDLSIDAPDGRVIARSWNEDGKEEVSNETMELPPDLANGLVTMLLKDIPANAAKTTFSLVAPTAKPRLIKLVVTRVGEENFSIGDSTRKASHYQIKLDLGGVAGAIAPLVGKKPADEHVWILPGDAPTFVKSEGPYYLGGPVWRTELTSPVWPDQTAAQTAH